MKITSFINSNDIREYLEKINYKFTPLEAAWLVYQCKLISIPEKQEAFKEIIRTMPDCEVKKRFNTVPQKSLHEFLGKYISLQNKFIDTFFNGKDSVYRLIYIYNNGDDLEDNTVYSSFDSLKNSIEPEEDVVFLKCVKCTPNSDENNITAEFTTDMKLIDISPNKLYDEEYDIYYGVFDGFFFNFPTPFKKGDIVCDKFKTNCFFDGPFVLTEIEFLDVGDRNIKYGLLEDGDTSDMTAGGYFQYADGSVYFEVMHSYMNLEYNKETDTGVRRILTAVSNYVKDKISIPLLLSGYHCILAEEYAKNFRPWGFTEEGMALAGIYGGKSHV